jgi:UDP-N-acetylglucosamine 4-epimerase
VTPYQELCQTLRAAPRRWLVTGAAGFIGSALVEALLALDQIVIGLDNFATGHRRNLDDVLGLHRGKRFTFVEGDICDAATCQTTCEGVDFILHQAALGSVPRSIDAPMSSHVANVHGFLQLMLVARDTGVKRVVYASSSSVYGDDPGLPKVEERLGRQLSPYAVTKRIDELYAGVLQDCYGQELIGLRYFNVFGRRQDPGGAYATVIPRWIRLMLSGQPCQIFGDGEISRDFCYIDNVVQANLLAACVGDEAVTNQVYNVGCGNRTNLNELFFLVRDHLAKLRPEVAAATPKHAPPRPGDMAHSLADITKIRRNLGYRTTHDINQGLAETVTWFAAHAG